MKLRGRLKAISEAVPHCRVLSDVGTDHAYIPINTVINGICCKAVASDVRSGPLEVARENINAYGLGDRIVTRLGYGLQPLEMDELEAVVIAGMGGVLIRDILEKDISRAASAKLLILQPMNAPEALRSWLYAKGFDIHDERLCKDEGRIYNIMSAAWTGAPKKIEEIDCYIGRRLIEKQDPLLEELTERKLKHVSDVLVQLESSLDNEGERRTRIYDYYKKLYGKLNEIAVIVKNK